MRCPKCKIEVPDGFSTCAVCRTPLEPSPAPRGGLGQASSLSQRLAAGHTGPHHTGPHHTGPHHTGPHDPERRDPGPRDPAVDPPPTGARHRRGGGPASAAPVPGARDQRPTGPHPPQAAPLGRTGPQQALPPVRDLRRTGPHQPLPAPNEDAANAESPADAGPPASQAGIGTEFLSIDPQVARETRMVEIPLPAVVKRAARQRERGTRTDRPSDAPEQDRPLEDVLEAARGLYGRLHRIDRWTIWILLLSLVAAFSPWAHVRGMGLVSGVESWGALSAGAVVLAALCVHRRTLRRRHAGALLLLQLLLAAAIAAVPLYLLIVTDTESTVWWGALATVAAGAGAVALTLARLVRFNA